MTANILTDREIALSTSGLSTLDDTLAQDAPLQLTLAQPYPEPDDVKAWAERRSSGPLAGGGGGVPPAGVTVRDGEIAVSPAACSSLPRPSAATCISTAAAGRWLARARRRPAG